MAHTLAAVWAISRSPLLFGGALPADAPTLALLTNKDFLYVSDQQLFQHMLLHFHSHKEAGVRFMLTPETTVSSSTRRPMLRADLEQCLSVTG